MSDLKEAEIFTLLVKQIPIKDYQLKKAYGEFIKQIERLNYSGTDCETIYRTLCLTRIEFVSLQPFPQYEQEKNVYKKLYLQIVILLIESEIELLKLRLSQNWLSFSEVSQPQKSKVYFVPNSRGLGIDSMGEFAVTLELSNQFISEEGKPVTFIDISNTLASAFNFTFGDAYKSKARVFIRKPYNLTRSLDYLKNLLNKESRNRKMKKDEFVSI